MDNETSSEIKRFEASNEDRPLRHGRYGNVDFDCFHRNQPRYNAQPRERPVGGDRFPPALAATY